MATKNNIYLEWDILYESVKTKKQRDKVVQQLLDGITNRVKSGGESIPLKYEVFKSESNKLLYVLRVYKVDEAAKPLASSTSRKAMAMSADIESLESSDSSMAFSGPVRPSGPPSQIPPGVRSLSFS